MNRKKLAESIIQPLNINKDFSKNIVKNRISFFTPKKFVMGEYEEQSNNTIKEDIRTENSEEYNEIIKLRKKVNSLLEVINIDKEKIIVNNNDIKLNDIVKIFDIECKPIFIPNKIEDLIDDINKCYNKYYFKPKGLDFIIYNCDEIDIVVHSFNNKTNEIKDNCISFEYPNSIIPIYSKTIFYYNQNNKMFFVFNPISKEMLFEICKNEVIKEISEYTK